MRAARGSCETARILPLPRSPGRDRSDKLLRHTARPARRIGEGASSGRIDRDGSMTSGSAMRMAVALWRPVDRVREHCLGVAPCIELAPRPLLKDCAEVTRESVGGLDPILAMLRRRR